MTPQQLLAAAQTVVERAPDAELVKNKVGNLAIVNTDGNYIGWVNLRYGTVGLFADDLNEVDMLDGAFNHPDLEDA